MERRRFLASSLAASAFALSPESRGQALASASKPREYYELRKYHLQSGPQTKLTESYVSDALMPALNRLGVSSVGVFNLTVGPQTPTLYLLIPSTNLETLVTARLRLAEDQAFLEAAAPFWNAAAKEPPFVRVQSTILIAFAGRPQLTLPASSVQKAKRIFELRTYESPSERDHLRKVEMFHSGEFEIFQKNGFSQVFYGDALIGERLPQLTYMLSFSDSADMDHKWENFRADPDWKTLSTSPKFAFEPIVSNISNLVLTPTAFSQI
jgi:NIPSNAP